MCIKAAVYARLSHVLKLSTVLCFFITLPYISRKYYRRHCYVAEPINKFRNALVRCTHNLHMWSFFVAPRGACKCDYIDCPEETSNLELFPEATTSKLNGDSVDQNLKWRLLINIYAQSSSFCWFRQVLAACQDFPMQVHLKTVELNPKSEFSGRRTRRTQ